VLPDARPSARLARSLAMVWLCKMVLFPAQWPFTVLLLNITGKEKEISLSGD
jgi:hypothetical protein